jgi:hypothetical protein
MYRTKTRPAFKTAAQEAAENTALDVRLERQDAERQQLLNALIAESQAQKSPEQLASDAAELARLDAKAAEQRRQHDEWLDRRRAEQLSPNWTGGT